MFSFQSIKRWWTDFNESREKRAISERLLANEKEAPKVINVMEFQGRLWVSYRGCPVVPVEHLKCDSIKTLNEARNAYVAWNV